MSTAEPSPAAPGRRADWRQQLARIGIGVAAAALLFFLGWMMGRSPVAELEAARDASRTRNAVLTAEAAVYRAAVALEQRNFGTANDYLRRADAALATLPADADDAGLSSGAAAALAEVRSELAGTDLNVAVDVEAQRSSVLQLAAQLDEIARATEPLIAPTAAEPPPPAAGGAGAGAVPDTGPDSVQ